MWRHFTLSILERHGVLVKLFAHDVTVYLEICNVDDAAQPKSNLVHFSLKIWNLVATILRINWPNFYLCPFLYLSPGICFRPSPASPDALAGLLFLFLWFTAHLKCFSFYFILLFIYVLFSSATLHVHLFTGNCWCICMPCCPVMLLLSSVL